MFQLHALSTGGKTDWQYIFLWVAFHIVDQEHQHVALSRVERKWNRVAYLDAFEQATLATKPTPSSDEGANAGFQGPMRVGSQNVLPSFAGQKSFTATIGIGGFSIRGRFERKPKSRM